MQVHSKNFLKIETGFLLFALDYVMIWFSWVIINKYMIHMEIYIFVILYAVSREGNGTPLQYSCLENPMDRGAC